MGRIFSKGALNSSSSKDNPINFSTTGIGAHGAAVRRRISRNVFTTNRGVNFVPGPATQGIQAVIASTQLDIAQTQTTVQIQVNVDRQPNNTTKILFRSGDTNQVTTDVSEMLFTNTIAQTLTINVNPAVAIDTYIDVEVLYGATTRVFIKDIAAALDVTPPGVSSLSEGTTTTFTVKLDMEPSAGSQVIDIASQDPQRFTVAPPSLVFSNVDWDQDQTVTITGVQDFYDRPDTIVGIDIIAQATSPEYAGKTESFVLTHVNIDVAAINVAPLNPSSNITEGQTATANVTLATKPTTSTNIDFTSNNTNKITVTPQLTFDDTNWNVAQQITLTSASDDIATGDTAVDITYNAVGAPEYNSIAPATIAVTHVDDDVAGFTMGAPTVNPVAENGGTSEVSLVLTSEPVDDVILDIAASVASKFTVNATSFTFTNTNWNTPQTLQLSAIDNNVAAGDVAVIFTVTPNGTSSAEYTGVVAQQFTVTRQDNDAAAIQIQNVSSNTVVEGASQTYEVVLTSEPSTELTLDITSDPKFTNTPSTLTFNGTTSLWNTPQVVTIAAVAQGGYTADESLVVTVQPSGTIPAEYSGLDDTETFTYDALPRIFTSSPTLSFASGAQGTFDIKLNGNPGQDNTVTLTMDNADITPTSTVFTFTTTDFDTLQTVTVDCAVAATGTITLTATDPTTTVVATTTVSVTVA